MNEQTPKITIIIGDNTHQINPNDQASILNIPWQERKKIIDIIELIKQSEHVKKPATDPVAKDVSPARENQTIATQLKVPSIKTTDVDFNPSKKSLSDTEVDQIMQQIIMTQKTTTKIPEKKDVYKWLLIVLAVIVGLALIF